MRPIVAIDIDGTLGEYHEHLLEFAEGYLGHSLKPDWTGYPVDWEEHLGIPKHVYREIKLAFRQGGMKRTMPVRPGAATLTSRLHTMGAEIWITTTRPWNRLDSVDPDTREWLRRNQITYDHLLYDEHKYHRLAELVDRNRVIFVLDDLPEMYDEAEGAFRTGPVVLAARQHNKAFPRPHMAQDLFIASDMAEVRINQWKQRNEHDDVG